MKKLEKKKEKKNKFEYVDIKLENDIYFKVLEICLNRKISIEEFISMAINNYQSELKNKNLIKGEEKK